MGKCFYLENSVKPPECSGEEWWTIYLQYSEFPAIVWSCPGELENSQVEWDRRRELRNTAPVSFCGGTGLGRVVTNDLIVMRLLV
jgi:hypothetical protein